MGETYDTQSGGFVTEAESQARLDGIAQILSDWLDGLEEGKLKCQQQQNPHVP